MTLVGDPRIIFLDEPTTGLDPRSRRTMWQIIRDLVAGGVTIFLTTQYLEEADQLADRIARARPRPAGRRGHPGRAQAPHPRRPHPAAVRRRAASSTRPPASSTRPPATTTRSPCRCPATAASRSLRALLDRLDDASIDVDELVRPHPRPRRRLPRPHRPARTAKGARRDDHPRPTPSRDSATMLRRNLRHMLRYPSMTLMLVGMPVVFLLLFVYVFGGTLGAGLGGAAGGRADYVNYVAPGDPPDDRGRRGAGHGHLGRDGHDRGHHRPVPHHGDLPRRRC